MPSPTPELLFYQSVPSPTPTLPLGHISNSTFTYSDMAIISNSSVTYPNIALLKNSTLTSPNIALTPNSTLTNPNIKARFHEPTKHAEESTLVGRLEANNQKFGLCQRLVSSADQYPFIFPLNCGQWLDTDRPVGRSNKLVWVTKQSSHRPINKIRHVKYFAQKSRRPIDSSFTLEVQGSIFIVGSPKNILAAHCTCIVISECQRPNFGRQWYFLLNFKAILCFHWSLHCTVVFAPKYNFSCQPIMKEQVWSSARVAPISIGRCLQVFCTLQSICINRWLIWFIFVASWNRALTLISECVLTNPNIALTTNSTFTNPNISLTTSSTFTNPNIALIPKSTVWYTMVTLTSWLS